MSETVAIVLDVPQVASGWTLTHEAYDARQRIRGLESGCAGVLRITENDGKRPAVATCDGCGFHVGVLQSALRGPAPSEQRSIADAAANDDTHHVVPF